jgi:hypothetical protein
MKKEKTKVMQIEEYLRRKKHFKQKLNQHLIITFIPKYQNTPTSM